MSAEPLDQVAAAFNRFARVETAGMLSPLYEQLARTVVADPSLCALAAEALPGQPRPNMLFAAVQYLLEDFPRDALAAFYPSLTAVPVEGEPGPAFRSFCERHRHAIVEILHTRMVQTNEVRRSACLLPAFGTVAAATQAPLGLIEIGPSAGLNLLFDRYRYDYGAGGQVGDPESPVLDCELRGEALPLTGGIPAVASRAGIDLNPLDLESAPNRRWLRALIWPEHRDRRLLLEAATSVALRHPPRLVGGDVFELLPAEVAAVPPGAAVCVFATFVLNQFSADMRTRLRSQFIGLSDARDIHLVVMGTDEFVTGMIRNSEDVALWLVRFSKGEETRRQLAECNPHGRWMKWLPGEPR